ncbi:MAG: hypothetical protein A2X13_13810 [Bacteroidetes bacterium GWC2_33_15]|nr:MAG: hypothetical protein A2X10_09025 [Bacteroidetes bacterium GWA2_33_15]OFX50422.1 MAG: hypothetical protein A2X13_13810 [Bacteroidetes bacterium GWC2_33_15]OFX66660.1 MAG: hypothetical protein A2X15_08065 [Bacteroidetes bacterium GWB2_32_14]OFX69278.1 MAG: hypothetical protein A2X14_08995 [Bacteroidetes bacterium GWD2_33_33]HAN18593.1 hypothetical protein [Bacteroidales bacterium]
MQYRFFSSGIDQDYWGRFLLFAKRNFWLYIPDIITFLFLLIPPYSWFETQIIIALVIILSIRDILVLKFSVYHLAKFYIDGDFVSVAIIRKNSLHDQINGKISEFDIKINSFAGFKTMEIFQNNKLVHRQFATGYWSGCKMKELYEQFYEIKRNLGFWRMFQGPMVN